MHPPQAEFPPIREIAPPVPAPYLSGIPQLPDDVLAAKRMTAKQRRRADKALRDLTARILAARHALEHQLGVKIVPEPPLRP